MTDTMQILNVLGLYARAHDQRDPRAMAALFTEDAVIDIFNAYGDAHDPVGTLQGRSAIGDAVVQMMQPHRNGAWSQNAISAPIVEVTGDTAEVDAQFMVFEIAAASVPDSGWPAGTRGAQGTITPIEAGQYLAVLHRAEQGWRIKAMRIVHRLPMAFA